MCRKIRKDALHFLGTLRSFCKWQWRPVWTEGRGGTDEDHLVTQHQHPLACVGLEMRTGRGTGQKSLEREGSLGAPSCLVLACGVTRRGEDLSVHQFLMQAIPGTSKWHSQGWDLLWNLVHLHLGG